MRSRHPRSGEADPSVLSNAPDRDGRWAWLLTWPWRWSVERLVSFAILNVAIAGGIAVGFPS